MVQYTLVGQRQPQTAWQARAVQHQEEVAGTNYDETYQSWEQDIKYRRTNRS
jgi:hypothetical protein